MRRITVFYHDQMIAQRDMLQGETSFIPVVPGEFSIQATRGIEFNLVQRIVEVKSGQISPLSFQLKQVIEPQKGWVCGDHHMHSFYNDGAQSPEMVVRAARSNGLSTSS